MHIFIKKIEPLTANQSILCAFIKNIKQNILFLTLWSLELIRETMIAPRSAYRRALLFVQILVFTYSKFTLRFAYLMMVEFQN